MKDRNVNLKFLSQNYFVSGTEVPKYGSPNIPGMKNSFSMTQANFNNTSYPSFSQFPPIGHKSGFSYSMSNSSRSLQHSKSKHSKMINTLALMETEGLSNAYQSVLKNKKKLEWLKIKSKQVKILNGKLYKDHRI